MKKNSQILLSIPDQTRDRLHEHARAVGISLSDLIRSLAERELVSSNLAHGLNPVPVGPVPELTRQVTDLRGEVWEIRLHTDGVWPYLHLSGRGADRLQVSGPWALSEGPLGPALETYRRVGRTEFDWDDPDFLEVCAAFELNPEQIRPQYRPRDLLIIRSLRGLLLSGPDPLIWPAALTLLRILRTDQETALSDWERVMEGGELSRVRARHPMLRRAGKRARPPRALSLCDGFSPIRLLPCRSDVGGLGSFYAGLGYDRIRPGLVAVLPDPRRHRNRVLTRDLARAGVRFIPEEDVTAYMREEGEAWRDRLLNGPGPLLRALRLGRRVIRKMIRKQNLTWKTKGHASYGK
jgi:hypothetical protein